MSRRSVWPSLGLRAETGAVCGGRCLAISWRCAADGDEADMSQ